MITGFLDFRSYNMLGLLLMNFQPSAGSIPCAIRTTRGENKDMAHVNKEAGERKWPWR
jgi:hypothetical protein